MNFFSVLVEILRRTGVREGSPSCRITMLPRGFRGPQLVPHYAERLDPLRRLRKKVSVGCCWVGYWFSGSLVERQVWEKFSVWRLIEWCIGSGKIVQMFFRFFNSSEKVFHFLTSLKLRFFNKGSYIWKKNCFFTVVFYFSKCS